MKSDPIRIAITGNPAECIRLLRILSLLKGLYDVICVSIATKDGRNKDLKKEIESFENDIHLYLRIEDLLINETVDAFIIASPLTMRHENIQAALYSGCHVLSQAPLAVTTRGGIRIVEAAAVNERLVAVYDSNRFSKRARILHWAIAEKIIGRPYYILDIAFGQEGVSPNICFGGDPIFHDFLHGGGILFHQALSDFAFLRYCFGDIIEVSGQHTLLEKERVIWGNNERIKQRFSCDAKDTLSAQLRFASNASGQYLRSWCGRGKIMENRLSAWGNRGAIENDNLYLDKQPALDLEEKWKESIGPNRLARLFPRNITDPLQLELMSFFSAVQDWKPGKTLNPLHTGREALKDLATGWAAVESHAIGKRIPVSEVESLKIEKVQNDLNSHWKIK